MVRASVYSSFGPFGDFACLKPKNLPTILRSHPKWVHSNSMCSGNTIHGYCTHHASQFSCKCFASHLFPSIFCQSGTWRKNCAKLLVTNRVVNSSNSFQLSGSHNIPRSAKLYFFVGFLPSAAFCYALLHSGILQARDKGGFVCLATVPHPDPTASGCGGRRHSGSGRLHAETPIDFQLRSVSLSSLKESLE